MPAGPWTPFVVQNSGTCGQEVVLACLENSYFDQLRPHLGPLGQLGAYFEPLGAATGPDSASWAMEPHFCAELWKSWTRSRACMPWQSFVGNVWPHLGPTLPWNCPFGLRSKYVGYSQHLSLNLVPGPKNVAIGVHTT